MTNAITDMNDRQHDNAVGQVETALYAWLRRSFAGTIQYTWDVLESHKATTRIKESLTRQIELVSGDVENSVAIQLGIFDDEWA